MYKFIVRWTQWLEILLRVWDILAGMTVMLEILFSPSRQLQSCYPKFCHDRFLSNPFQCALHQSLHN
jgi:hypothetical protein